MNNAPRHVFVASSSEQLKTARAVAAALSDGQEIIAEPWTEKTFNFSDTYIESLEKKLETADFAVVVLTADDPAVVRKKAVNLPRDNVIFELGLFMGRLGRERVFFLVDGDSGTQIASDLSGVRPVQFNRKVPGADFRSLKTVARALSDQMRNLPLRRKWPDGSGKDQERIWRFSKCIAGGWWERMRTGEDDRSALSFITVAVDEPTGTPTFEGKVFALDGERIANWWSVTSAVVLGDRPRVCYSWKGAFDKTKGQERGGSAEITFESQDPSTAEGYYYDTNFALLEEPEDEDRTRIKNFGIYRCAASDVEVMRYPKSDEAKALIAERLRLRG